MNAKEFVFGSLLAGTALAATRTLFAKTGSAKPKPNSTGSDLAPPQGDAPPRGEASIYEAVDAYVERQMRRLNMPGAALAIVQGDRIVHQRGFGRARPGGEPPTPQTPFFIGSLTKSFTALAVMKLVEAGKVELDAPVQRYLPWFRVADPQASAQMTVRHLLNQTSGLPESAGEIAPSALDDLPDGTERQARTLASVKLSHPVGAVCQYCNANYDLLGLVVEAASGESYADYLQEQIFTPLEMNHTYVSRDVARQNGLAMGHRYWFAHPIAAQDLPIVQRSLPSGQLISTTEDMARYLMAHLNGGRVGDTQVLSRSGIEELHRGAVEYGKMGVSAGRYAMGWFDGELGQTRVVWHSGALPDFGAYTALFPEQQMGIVLLFNACQWWYNPVVIETGMGAAAVLAGEPYAPTPYFSVLPLMLRGRLLIPLLQIADVAATVGLLRRWRSEPDRSSSGGRSWKRHLLLPLIPNLVIALMLRSVLRKRGEYLKLYMPDYWWLAAICGSFALAWSFVRTGLLLGARRKALANPEGRHGLR